MQQSIIKRRESRKLNTLKRIMLVQNLANEFYEPGNQSKSKAQAYRLHINKVYPMGERTFWRYMGTDVKKEMQDAQHGQMILQFD